MGGDSGTFQEFLWQDSKDLGKTTLSKLQFNHENTLDSSPLEQLTVMAEASTDTDMSGKESKACIAFG